jgi:formate hydrogenlyase subunit 4
LNPLSLIVNLVLAILLAPLIDGLRRMVTARLQNRVGPKVTQSWHDVFKLFSKELILPEASGFLFVAVPILTLVLSLAMFATMSTVTGQAPIEGGGILFMELVVLSAFIFALSGSASGNPYGIVGGSREVILATLVEPSMILSLISLILLRNSSTLDYFAGGYVALIPLLMSGLAYFLCLLAESGRIPFDLAEAESELNSGPLIEFSGPSLAILKFSQYLRTLALSSIPGFYIWALISPRLVSVGNSAAIVISYIVSILLCTLVLSLAESLNARFRLFEASRFYGFVLLLSAAAFTMVYIAPILGW